jgi:hypothetical protein
MTRIEHQLKIQSLASQYCWIVDAGLDGKDESYINRLLELFSDDPEVDYGPFGKYKGREKIHAFFSDFVYKNFDSFRHYVQNFVIEIDCTTAIVKYYLNFYGIREGQSVMASGKYYADCEKKGEEWKFKTLRAEFYFFNHVEAAWGQKKVFF